MRLIVTVAVLVTIFHASKCEWWENANYYQIYPKSFKDSDGDGMGDLNGIAEKAGYLASLGINGVWLSPIFTSPQADGGYDISNFTEIDPMFGDMKDFENLVKTFKDHDINLILDFVPNHSSHVHSWFVKSEAKDEKYKDYYIWHDGINDGTDQPKPPNNWLSVFRGSAWEWSEIRQQYYLHQFAIEQPDLNFRNNEVIKEMKDVLRFWLNKGVAGFRVDAIPHLFEIQADEDGNYPDEPLSGNCADEEEAHCYLSHVYTQNYPETIDMVYQWREVLDEFKDFPRIMMTEAYTSLDTIMKYFGNETVEGSHIPFNFEVLTGINSKSVGMDVKKVTEHYLNHLPIGRSGNWVLGNHDQRRIVSRLGGEERADLFNFFLQTMPGHAITYQGEEFLMKDGEVTWEETQDPQACNTNETVYDQFSRDPARTPMQWDNTTFAGFTNTTPWLPVGKDYLKNNVEVQLADPDSYLNIFKELVKLRQQNAFKNGSYESALGLDADVYSYLRSDEKDVYMVVLNFGNTNKTINFSKGYRALGSHGEVVLTTKNTAVQKK